MESQRFKEVEVQKISTTVFVTSSPDHFNAKDLWNTCKQYGTVVDAYIPNKRSKADDDHKNIGVKGYSNSYARVVKGSQSLNTEMENKPALVLDNSCLNQHDNFNFLIGKVKDFVSLSNLKVVL
ncbi:nucleotide-binding alpha-beta plait domain-containing protein, partial [Tanacetum coccineum]